MGRELVYSLFVVFYLFSVLLSESKASPKVKALILAFACGVLAVSIGQRTGWPDQVVYVGVFENAPFFSDLSLNDEPSGYKEKGYYYLASLIKTIYDDSTFYLTVMGALSMGLLFLTLKNYSEYSLLGLSVYVARFLLNRDFIQMRSSLAILLIILAIKYIYERNAYKYFLVVLLAYQFHHMALIAVPMYFFYKLRLSRNQVIYSLILSFILSQTLAGAISGAVDSWSEDLQYDTYTQGEYVNEAKGLANPMIYFQIGILMLFIYKEELMSRMTRYYDLLKMAYFYSTLILIFFCNYTALSGRTSTMFATLEVSILPMVVKGSKRNMRYVYYIGIGLVLLYFFIAKYQEARR